MSLAPTKQQQRAIETVDAHLCVDAGAGSGKTRVLVERIMHLLDQAVPLTRIVAITFTRKAAAEMKERLREAIHDRPSQASPDEMTKWRSLEYRVDTARITTIDAYCASLLRENALHLGLDPDFAILADAEAVLLRNAIAAETIEGLLDDAAPEARRAVIEYGLSPTVHFIEAALAMPAALDAANDRYRDLKADALLGRWRDDIERIQSVRYEHLRTDPRVHRLIAHLSAYEGQCRNDEDKCEQSRRNAVHALSVIAGGGNPAAIREALAVLAATKLQGGSPKAWGEKETLDAVKAMLKAARDLADTYADPVADPEVERRAAERTRDLLAVYRAAAEAYAAAKEARTALDFTDLLTRVRQVLEDRPRLRARAASRVGHLLIDEFQDTNDAQLAMAEQLIALDKRDGAKLFVVGDAKQSIYRFRGAQVEVFEKAKKMAGEVLPLDVNFRSVPEIIAFVNDFFASSGMLHRVEPRLNGLQAHRDSLGDTHVEFLIPEPVPNANADEYREIEAALIADRIAAMCAPDGLRVHDRDTGATRPAAYGDVAILFRKSTNLYLYEQALRARGIPANVLEGSGFYKRQEIIDLRNLLTAAIDPWNEYALAGLLRSPIVAVSDDTLMELCAAKPLAQAFRDGAPASDPDDAARLTWARSLLDEIRVRSEWPLPALLRYILQRTGFEAVLLAQHHGVQKASNIRKLVDIAGNFNHTGRAQVRAFAEYLDTLTRRGLREGEAEVFAAESGAVTLMTVHKSKGLEFPIVFIADAGAPRRGGDNTRLCYAHPQFGLAAVVHDTEGESKPPALAQLLKALESEDDAAEEARVLYVAMTRARDCLVMSGKPNPDSTSWLAEIDAFANVTPCGHNAALSGAGWTARVLRRPSATRVAPRAKQPEQPQPLPDFAQLEAQAAPLSQAGAIGPAAPVSAVLDLIHPESAVASEIKSDSSRQGSLTPLQRGNAAHELLERWDFGGPPPVHDVARDTCPARDLRPVCAATLEEIATRLQQSSLWNLLQNATRIDREIPFVFAVNGTRLNGVIDVLLDGETLIDYKTGQPDAAKHARYETQLRLYAAALEAITGRSTARAILYYLDTGESRDVDIGAEALAATLARVHRVLRE